MFLAIRIEGMEDRVFFAVELERQDPEFLAEFLIEGWRRLVELHLKLTQVLHLKVTHLEEPEYGSSVLGFSSFCLLGFLRRAVFEAVAIVAGFNDVAVMSQPVE